MKHPRIPEIDKTIEYLEKSGYSTLLMAKILGFPRDMIYNYKAGKGFIRECDYELLKQLEDNVRQVKAYAEKVSGHDREDSKVLNADHVDNA